MLRPSSRTVFCSALWLALITPAAADVASLPAPDLRAALDAVQRNAVKREDSGQMTRSGAPIAWQGPTATGEIVFQPIVARVTDQVCDQTCESPCRHFMFSAEQADASRRYEGLVCAEDSGLANWRIVGEPRAVSLRILGPQIAQAGARDQEVAEIAPTGDTKVGSADTVLPANDAAEIRVAQEGLTGLGYYDGPLDGVMTPALIASLQQFTDDERLPAKATLEVVRTRLAITARRSELARAKACGGVTGPVVVCGERAP